MSSSSRASSTLDLMLRASLDLSDEEDVDAGDEAAEALHDHNGHGDQECFAEDAAANESIASFDAARFAVVEGLQLLLSSMQSAVDEQVVLSLLFRRCKHVLLDADA